MLGFLSIETIFCQMFSRFQCKAKISSSGDEEVEKTKLTAAAAITFEKGSVFGDCAGEADAPAVAASVEGFGCCCKCCWWRCHSVIGEVEERRMRKKTSECRPFGRRA